MSGTLIVLVILLCFAVYIVYEKHQHNQKALEAYKRIIKRLSESEPMYQQILKSANLALSTDNSTYSSAAVQAAILAYNKLATLLDACKADLLLVKQEQFQSASDAVDIIQTRVDDGKERIDDSVRYLKSLPMSMFTMAKCPIPCYAEKSQ